MATPFHLGWFLGNGFGVYGWDDPFGGVQGRDYAKPDFYLDFARALERACFDFVMLEDGSHVPDGLNDSSEAFLSLPLGSPKHDPAVAIPIMASVTSHLGLAPTLSTTEYPPFLLARLVSTFDHISDGRAGWNVVTSRSEATGHNHGIVFPEKEDRYARAEEYVELVKKLWHSWEPDAIVRDLERGVFADHTKVHRVDFEGQFYRSRGPLNAAHMPQSEAVIIQAGQSGPGRAFASRHAEVVVGIGNGIADLKAYKQDMTQRLIVAGRKPDSCKLMYLVMPVVGETDAEARERYRHWTALTERDITWHLALGSKVSGIDYGSFDLDAPLPDVLPTRKDGVWQETAAPPKQYNPDGTEMTFRQTIEARGGGHWRGSNTLPFVGTPDAVASQMEEAMQEIGGDGFLIQNLYLTRRYFAEICDGLVPALQRRGLMREHYAHSQFRENLLEY